MSLEYRIELSETISPIHAPLILHIPCQHILKQTTNVEAWLLYLGFCVCGVSGSLHTATSDGKATGVTLTITNLLQSAEEGVTCPSASKDRQSVRLPVSPFSQGCQARDGGCVLQNTFNSSDSNLSDSQRAQRKDLALKSCQVIHLSTHSKGDVDMDLISKARAPNAQDYMHKIDDIRNGLTMDASLQAAVMPNYGAAFLHVPNEYMTVEDAVLHDLDNRAQDEVHRHFLTDEVRKSPCVFNPVDNGRLWDNKCLRQPEDRSHWPPPFLWDFLFGVAAIKNWATPESHPALTDERYTVHAKTGNLRGSASSGDAREIGGGMRNGYDVWDIMACIVPAHRLSSQEEKAHEKVTQWLSDSGMES
ncbi:hypothetical protein CPB85DRAFT_1458466 [Mucidula mucida]|nr:hypothetical protein CPB85DRAFT_1458466 [Mucidula mucida]